MDKNRVISDTAIPSTDAEMTELIMVKVTPSEKAIFRNVNNYIVRT